MRIYNKPALGGTAPRNAFRTAHKLASFAQRHLSFVQAQSGVRRYLDVGCGNGFITELTAANTDFDEVFGIDLEGQRLEEFQAHSLAKPNYKVSQMSASQIGFSGEFFSFITSFEVLEHIDDLDAAVREIVRVCRRGGVVVISVPQVWFPIENHGCRLGDRIYEGKIPLLPYIRPLHRKYSLARVFSSREMDNLFLSKGLKLLATAYASPQFERASAREDSWERRFVFLRSMLSRCENIPILRVLTGVSMLKAYRKPL
jgi:SAM-dependent methyltransferase